MAHTRHEHSEHGRSTKAAGVGFVGEGSQEGRAGSASDQSTVTDAYENAMTKAVILYTKKNKKISKIILCA